MVDLIEINLDSEQLLVDIWSAYLKSVFGKNLEILSGIGFVVLIN